VGDQVSHTYKTTDKIIVLYILIFKFLDSKWKTSLNLFKPKNVPSLQVALRWRSGSWSVPPASPQSKSACYAFCERGTVCPVLV